MEVNLPWLWVAVTVPVAAFTSGSFTV